MHTTGARVDVIDAARAQRFRLAALHVVPRSNGAGRAEQQRYHAGAAMRVRAERGLRVAREAYGITKKEGVRVGTARHVGTPAPNVVRAEELVQKALRAEAHVATMAW